MSRLFPLLAEHNQVASSAKIRELQQSLGERGAKRRGQKRIATLTKNELKQKGTDQVSEEQKAEGDFERQAIH